MIVWTDWHGERFVFCTRLCLEMYRRFLGDPTMKHLLPVFLPTFGCWWCGADLAGGPDWLDEAGIVRLEETHDEDPREPA